MNTVRSIEAYYPLFSLGCEPAAVLCRLSIIEANGKRYVRTPFACLDAFADDDLERLLQPGQGYYTTEADCLAYLTAEYPWWQQAAPIMDALMRAKHVHGDICGPARIADKIGVSVMSNSLYLIARGHKSFGLKRVRAAVKVLVAPALAS